MTSTAADFTEVAVKDIHPNPDQPRRLFDEAALAELAASIKESGLLQPITVRRRPAPKRSGYIIIAGERRWRAAKIAGVRTVPVRVMDLDEGSAYVLSVAENIARADMTVMEETDAYHRLVTDYGKTTADVARMFGKTEQGVEWRLGLLSLTTEARTLVDAGTLKPNLAWYVARLSPENQGVIIRRHVRGDFTSEHEASTFAQALAMREAQGSFFDMDAPETEVTVAARKRARAEVTGVLEQVSRLAAVLERLAKEDPAAFADALGDDTAAHVRQIEDVAALALKARGMARHAKGHAEARTYTISSDLLPA